MSGDGNFNTFLDADDLMRPDSAAFGFPKMARAAAKAAYRAASRPTATATETATLREHVQSILDHEYSYVMSMFSTPLENRLNLI